MQQQMNAFFASMILVLIYYGVHGEDMKDRIRQNTKDQVGASIGYFQRMPFLC